MNYLIDSKELMVINNYMEFSINSQINLPLTSVPVED